MSCCNIRMILFVYLTHKNLILQFTLVMSAFILYFTCAGAFYFNNFTIHMHFYTCT